MPDDLVYAAEQPPLTTQPYSCRELARQLLRLPTDLLGSSARLDLARHLDRNDWIAGDVRPLLEQVDRLADHLQRIPNFEFAARMRRIGNAQAVTAPDPQ